MREAIVEAAEQEKFLKNKGEFKTQITALCDMEDEELEEQDLDNETRQGRQPYRRFNNFRNNKPNQNGLEVTTTMVAKTSTSRIGKT